MLLVWNAGFLCEIQWPSEMLLLRIWLIKKCCLKYATVLSEFSIVRGTPMRIRPYPKTILRCTGKLISTVRAIWLKQLGKLVCGALCLFPA